MAERIETLKSPMTSQAGGAPAGSGRWNALALYLVLFGFAILFLAPFIFAIANSFKTAPQIAPSR